MRNNKMRKCNVNVRNQVRENVNSEGVTKHRTARTALKYGAASSGEELYS